jgi:hypothetical protein
MKWWMLGQREPLKAMRAPSCLAENRTQEQDEHVLLIGPFKDWHNTLIYLARINVVLGSS